MSIVNFIYFLLLGLIWSTSDVDEMVGDDHDNGNIGAKILLVIDQHSTIKHQSGWS